MMEDEELPEIKRRHTPHECKVKVSTDEIQNEINALMKKNRVSLQHIESGISKIGKALSTSFDDCIDNEKHQFIKNISPELYQEEIHEAATRNQSSAIYSTCMPTSGNLVKNGLTPVYEILDIPSYAYKQRSKNAQRLVDSIEKKRVFQNMHSRDVSGRILQFTKASSKHLNRSKVANDSFLPLCDKFNENSYESLRKSLSTKRRSRCNKLYLPFLKCQKNSVNGNCPFYRRPVHKNFFPLKLSCINLKPTANPEFEDECKLMKCQLLNYRLRNKLAAIY